jgi:hypothetical protein
MDLDDDIDAAPVAGNVAAGMELVEVDEIDAGAEGRFTQQHADKFFTSKLAELDSDSKRFVFSMPMDPACIRSLQSRLALDGDLTTVSHGGYWWEEGASAPRANQELSIVESALQASRDQVSMVPQLWFAVTALAPSRAKRAVAGQLVTSDVGMSVHKPLALLHATSQVVVSVEPANMTQCLAGGLSSMPLVLSPQLMPLFNLKRTFAWEVMQELRYTFDHAISPVVPLPEISSDRLPSEVLHRMLEGLVSSDGAFTVPDEVGDPDLCECLEHYKGLGFVVLDTTTGEQRWSLSPTGQFRLQVGQICGSGKPVFAVDDSDRRSMMMYELLHTLAKDGWQCRAVGDEGRTAARLLPYEVGGDKIWYMFDGDVLRYYLMALAVAHEHMQSVPHFASYKKYADILFGQDRPVKKRRVSCIPSLADVGDEWAILEAMNQPVAPRPRGGQGRGQGRGRGRGRGRIAAIAPIAGAIVDEESSSMRESASGDSDSSSSHPESASNGSVCAPSPPSRSSSSNSEPGPCSGSSDAEAGLVSDTLAHAPLARNMYAHTLYGLCRYTPKYDAEGQQKAVQMTCLHPEHKASSVCQKTLSVKLAGNIDTALLMLKTWVVLGIERRSKADHGEAWKEVPMHLEKQNNQHHAHNTH